MKTLIALWVLNLTVSLAISTSLTISDVVLGSYGDKSLVDSIAVFGTYNKPNLPDGKVDFRCTAIEPMSEARLPQAPEKIPCKLLDRSGKVIPKSLIVDYDNPSITLSLKNSSVEINDKQLLSEPLGLLLRYQEYSFGHHYAEEFIAILRPESFRWLLHESLALIKPMKAESIS